MQIKNNNLTDKSLGILKKLICPILKFSDNSVLSAEAIRKINFLRQPRFKLSLSKIKSNSSCFGNGYLSTQALHDNIKNLLQARQLLKTINLAKQNLSL